MSALRPLLLLLLACEPSQAELRARAQQQAAGGDLPTAAETCASLEVSGRESCLSDVLHALPDATAADCARFSDGAHDECEFLKAEALVARGRDAEAAAACARAARFRADCAEHIWKAVERERPAQRDAMLQLLAAALPEQAATLDPRSRPLQHKALRLKLNDIGRVSPSACADAPRSLCDDVLARMLRRRWISAARRDRRAREVLCAARGGEPPVLEPVPPGWEGLVWDRSPELDAGFQSAADAVCGGVEDRSAKGFGVHAVPEPEEP